MRVGHATGRPGLAMLKKKRTRDGVSRPWFFHLPEADLLYGLLGF